MSEFEIPWRNGLVYSQKHETFVRAFSHSMYIQHCTPDELKFTIPKLYKIIMNWVSAFDDWYYYWLTRGERYIRRMPLWMHKKRTDAEKPKRFEPNKKLTSFCQKYQGVAHTLKEKIELLEAEKE